MKIGSNCGEGIEVFGGGYGGCKQNNEFQLFYRKI